MKTKEEIIEYLENYYISYHIINRILGFLDGKGLDCDINYCSCDHDKDEYLNYETFIEWFNSEPKKECVHCTTQKEFDRVLEYAKIRGWKWITKHKPLCHTDYFNRFRSNTLLELCDEFSYFSIRGTNTEYNILSFQEFEEKYLEKPKNTLQEEVLNINIEDIRINPFKSPKLTLIPKNKFKVGQKVKIKTNKQSRVYEILKVERTNMSESRYGYQYFLCSGEWVKERKLELYVEEKECVFKKGDWFRLKDVDKVGKVFDMSFSNLFKEWIIKTEDGLEYWANRCELWTPKEGEFVYCSTNKYLEWIYHKTDLIAKTSCSYAYREESDFTDDGCGRVVDDCDIYFLRPATEKEKQSLIKAVEEKYKKTWDEDKKEWVDYEDDAVQDILKRVEYRLKMYGLYDTLEVVEKQNHYELKFRFADSYNGESFYDYYGKYFDEIIGDYLMEYYWGSSYQYIYIRKTKK